MADSAGQPAASDPEPTIDSAVGQPSATEPQPEHEEAQTSAQQLDTSSTIQNPPLDSSIPPSLDQTVASVPNLNGTSDIPLDPSAYGMNGYPLDDPNFMMTDMNFMQAPMMNVPLAQPMTADEIALYDRQIRLWGVAAQEKIRSANILLVGLKGLGAEIAKNLVLAGVGTLTILEHEIVADHDLGTQFFVTQEQVGQNRAQAAQPEIQKLNPRVNLFVDPDVVFNKMNEYFMSFDITIVTGLPPVAVASINSSCRNFNRKFYAADTYGMYGYIFADLGLHQFTQERIKSNVATKAGTRETTSRSIISVAEKVENGKKMEVVLKQEEYSPFLLSNLSPLPAEATRTVSKTKKVTPLLSCIRAVFEFQQQSGGRLPGANQQDLAMFTKLAHDKHLELGLPTETMRAEFLRSFLQNLGSELSPVVAYLGGRLAQDVINVLGQREQPLQNFLLFDGETLASPVYSLQPSFEDVAMPMGMDMAVGVGAEGANGTLPDVGAGSSAAGMNGAATAA
jgi:ubiquitin-like 1-activating enzyme E1 A